MDISQVFTAEWAGTVFPPERTADFFEALFGGAEEGAYDIALRFVGDSPEELLFSFDLKARPGRCLACNLTHGLPHVFSRHPVINVRGLVEEIAGALGKTPEQFDWELRPTRELTAELFSIPLAISVKK